jgi:hypothetical protein
MSRSRGIHRIVIALALAAALLGAAAPLAAQPHGPAPASSPLRLGVDALWAWARLWLGLPTSPATSPGTRKSACEGGLSIDPDGHTVCKETGARNDGGLQIDPNGLQTASPPPVVNGDGGAHIDPDG